MDHLDLHEPKANLPILNETSKEFANEMKISISRSTNEDLKVESEIENQMKASNKMRISKIETKRRFQSLKSQTKSVKRNLQRDWKAADQKCVSKKIILLNTFKVE